MTDKDLISRREAALENALRDLLKVTPTSEEGRYMCSTWGSESQALRAQADYIDRKDAAILHARKMVCFDKDDLAR